MKQKFLSLLLVAVMVVGLLPTATLAGEGTPSPTSIAISVDENSLNGFQLIDGKLVGAGNGSSFRMKAVDQDGNPTPVTWKSTMSTANYSVDPGTGVITYSAALNGGGSSSNIWVQATSALDTGIKSKDTSITAYGYKFSDANKNKTVALSEDGQTAKNVSLTGGYTGHTVWSAEIPTDIAEWASEPGKGTSTKLNVYRPGTFTVTEKLDVDETMTDTATVTVTGVAVEDANGNRSKVYVDEGKTIQLTAFSAEGRTIYGWSSSDETVAKVDAKGLVTGVGVGSVIITATDSESAKGGIKVVVESTTTPYFENLQFLSSAINNYSTAYKFSPATLKYSLPIRTYSTSTLTIQNTTLYNSDRFTATAAYTDSNGAVQSVPVSSGAVTKLENIPFGSTVVTITLADKENAENKTEYTLNVTRPRDNTKVIKNNTGIAVVPDGRALSTAQYNAKAEGTIFRADETGVPKTTTTTGAYSTAYYYRTYLLGSDKQFAMTFTGNTAYQHLRYSTDNGATWAELPQGGGTTAMLPFPAADTGNSVAKVTVQILDDETYYANVQAGKDGFADAAPNTYTVWVERINTNPDSIAVLTASIDNENADSYPAIFNPQIATNVYVVPNGTSTAKLTYTVTEGASVTVGTSATAAGTAQTPELDGSYQLPLKTSAQYVNVTKDGVTKQYNFKLQAHPAKAYADRVVDYLCINSQYTNGSNGNNPLATLNGTLSSLGSWGGYITYYFNKPLTDDPNNKYGMDFYAYGNANKDTSTPTHMSFFEPGQVWVSEDGGTWYALAGSAHYEDDVDWNYTVNYSKAANGKTAWEDNHGNSNDGTSKSGAWVSPSVYFMNDLAKSDKITLTGIMLPSADGTVTGSGATDAYAIKWGYVDALPNGTVGADVNPYVDNSDFSLSAAGFDLEWAVDADGMPVDVSKKEFHYVKVVTASNIWHSSFGEKSTESNGVFRTTAQAAPVGRTQAPAGVTITDGASVKTVNFIDGKQVYDVNLDDMKYVSVTVNGTDDTDNIYVNNQRVVSGAAANGIKVTKEAGEKLVRILVQNGDKEPDIYLLRLTSSASSSNELIEGVKITADGATRTATTNDGNTYRASVGYRVDCIGIVPIAASDVKVTVSPAEGNGGYALTEGENTFTLTAENQTVTLVVTRAAAPASTGEITAYFTLKGDEKHGDTDEPHTLKNGGLTTWIGRTSVKVSAPAVVLDVLEKALGKEYTYTNAGGNYISEINGLSEFDNGPYSGWMFTVNGKYPNCGVSEQTVKNGDVIVFHYTDDYTLETDQEEWSRSRTVPKDEEIPVIIPEESVTKDEGIPAEPILFKDVPKDAFYCDAVLWAVEKGITNGTSETEFSPDGGCTRAQVVTFLWRAAGSPAPAASAQTFSDVEGNDYYSSAVLWAVEQGITNGTGKDQFSPDRTITRAEAVTLLARYANGSGSGTLPFTDVPKDSYYSQSVQWAAEKEITAGTGKNTFSPKLPCTRGQIVTFLYRLAAEK